MNKDRALEEGARVKKMLKSKGWRVHVWENMGWHVSLRKGTITLNWYSNGYTDKLTDFWALMSTDGLYPGTGSPELSTKRRFNNPNSAVTHQLNIAKAHLRKVTRAYQRSAA